MKAKFAGILEHRSRPGYETAAAGPMSTRATHKEYYEKMFKLLREEQKKNPLMITVLRNRYGFLTFHYREKFAGAEKMAARFHDLGRRLERLVQQKAERYEEREMQIEKEEKEFEEEQREAKYQAARKKYGHKAR